MQDLQSAVNTIEVKLALRETQIKNCVAENL